jgi:hypothetical protein
MGGLRETENMMTSGNKEKQRKTSLLALAAVFVATMAIPFMATAQEGTDEEVTLANLEERVEAAQTADDHRAIAAFHQKQAEEAQKSAGKHETMAQMYKRTTSKVVRSSGALVEHCNKLSADYRALADNLLALAKEHEVMASETK